MKLTIYLSLQLLLSKCLSIINIIANKVFSYGVLTNYSNVYSINEIKKKSDKYIIYKINKWKLFMIVFKLEIIT